MAPQRSLFVYHCDDFLHEVRFVICPLALASYLLGLYKAKEFAAMLNSNFEIHVGFQSLEFLGFSYIVSLSYGVMQQVPVIWFSLASLTSNVSAREYSFLRPMHFLMTYQNNVGDFQSRKLSMGHHDCRVLNSGRQSSLCI